ncbi:MAG: hypothetical protein IT381_29990 [Deltaproteobacteria bacterium]|nr:hypothetical protein [Deltaproteobacteria bacterium]
MSHTLEMDAAPEVRLRALPAHFGLAALGHLAFGATAAIGLGPKAMASTTVVTPLALLVAIVSLLPLFYITLTLRGGAPALAAVVRASLVGWRDCGLIMLGAFPAAWFLASSFVDHATGGLFVAAEAFLCARLALSSFHRNVFSGAARTLIGRAAFIAWGALIMMMTVQLCHAWVIV